MNVFDLFASIKLDSSEYDEGLNEAEKKSEGAGAKIGKGLLAAGKAAGVAIGAAATAIGALAKKSVEGYAEQEQLVGGVQKLYGNMGMSLEEYAKSVGKSTDEVEKKWNKLDKAQNLVLKNARNAYKTAGMDMNTYMENATSFSAALINSLKGDTVKAAKQTDIAMRAISDNVNTFGSDMDSVTNAFMGFSKQNYTMLDNLKLGYGGTKSEMERLIADANKWGKENGKASNLSINSFADVVTAIQQVQEAQGIAGTTQREAASTIEGSLGMLKGAWSNLVTGFTDSEADLGQLITNVVDSAKAAFDNLLPAVTQALEGIGSFVEQIAPIIAEQLPTLVETILPPLLSAATSLIAGLVNALPELLVVVVEQIPTIMQSLWDAIVETLPALVEAITTNAPALIDAGMQLVTMLGDGFTQGWQFFTEQLPTKFEEFLGKFDEKAPEFLNKGVDIIQMVADGIINGVPVVIETVGTMLQDLLNHLTENMPEMLSKGVDLITNIANGMLNALPTIMSNIGTIMLGIVDFIIANLPTFLQNGMKLIMNLAQGLIKALPNIIQSAVKIITSLINKLISALPQIIQTGFKLIAQLAIGLIKALPDIIAGAGKIISSIFDAFTSINWLEIGTNIVNGIISGLSSMGKAFLDAIVGLAKSAFQGIKDFFGIHSPSKKMRDEIGKNIVKGLIKGVDDEKGNAKKSAEELGALYVSAAKKKVDTLKENNEISLMEEWAYWEEIREHTVKGSQAYDEATKMIGKAKNNINKEVEALNKEYTEGVQKIIDDLDKEVIKLEETYTKAVADRQKSLMGQMNIFEAFTPKEGKTSGDLISAMESQMQGMAEYDSTMTSLQAKLAESAPAFYEELKNMNVDQLDTLRTINNMSQEELDYYVALYDAKQMFAEDRAKKDNEELKKQTDEQIEQLKTNADNQIAELEKKYKKGIKQIGDMGEKQFKKAGKQSVEGMGVGMNTQFDVLEKQMMARARALAASVAAALQIHSPSKVFADEVGKWIPLGIAEGFENSMPKAENAMLSSIDDMKANVASNLDMSDVVAPLEFNSSMDSSPIAGILYGIYELLTGMPEDMKAAMNNTSISINNREFARLVKAV